MIFRYPKPWIGLFSCLMVVISTDAKAEGPAFTLPIDCVAGESCWIVNYVDLDKAPKATADYKCGWRTYDKHKGVDFGIQNIATMKAGVPVLAAAPGRVLGMRDGMEDISLEDLKDPKTIRGRECGNGAVVQHADGWRTQYCHMKKGSVLVKKGEKVSRGQPIGLVGLSGRTQFPHVHFQVSKGKKIIDPFQGDIADGKCGEEVQPLWDKKAISGFDYGPSIYMAGFAPDKPKPRAVRKGLYQDDILGRMSPKLILWADIFGLAKDDKVVVKIIDPSGEFLLDYAATINKNSARKLIYAGKPKKKKFWDSGVYTGSLTIVKNSGTEQEKTYSITRKVEIR